MNRVEQIMKIMADLKARSGKNYAVQVEKGVAQLVIITKEGRKTVVTKVEGVCGPNVYKIADQLERSTKDLYIEMAAKAGAEMVELSDGRWMVSTREGAEKPVACCWKNLGTAAQLFCCEAELILPISA